MQILVIEDEARILAFVARALKAEGCTVGVADDGEERPRRGRSRTRTTWSSSTCFCPGMDGLDVLRAASRAASPSCRS